MTHKWNRSGWKRRKQPRPTAKATRPDNPCPQCSGTGKVAVDPFGLDGKSSPFEVATCPRCDGTGIEIEKRAD